MYAHFALSHLPSLFECLHREAQQVRRVTDILGALVNCSRVVGRKDVSPEGTFPTVRPRTPPHASKTCRHVAKTVLFQKIIAFQRIFSFLLSFLIFSCICCGIVLCTSTRRKYASRNNPQARLQVFYEKVIYAMVVISMYYVCMYVCMYVCVFVFPSHSFWT